MFDLIINVVCVIGALLAAVSEPSKFWRLTMTLIGMDCLLRLTGGHAPLISIATALFALIGFVLIVKRLLTWCILKFPRAGGVR